MTTTRLAKEYAKLTAAERFALIVAAGARGDDSEQRRLIDAAPREMFSVPHTFGRSMAFLEVADMQRMELLELAGLYLRAFSMSDGLERDGTALRLFDTALFFGFLFNVQSDGWRQFCAGVPIDGDAVTQYMPGGELLTMAAELSAKAAFNADGALAFFRRKRNSDAVALPTADGVAEALRSTFDARADWWG